MFIKAFTLCLPFILYVTCQPFLIEKLGQSLDADFEGDLQDMDFILIRTGTEESKTKAKLQGPRTYVLGQREPGDALVSQAAKNQRYPTMQNVNLTLTYPTSGYGKLVTYVEINVNQTSDVGRAYIVAGGYHQHMVKIVVQAFNTFQMDYSVLIYGV